MPSRSASCYGKFILASDSSARTCGSGDRHFPTPVGGQTWVTYWWAGGNSIVSSGPDAGFCTRLQPLTVRLGTQTGPQPASMSTIEGLELPRSDQVTTPASASALADGQSATEGKSNEGGRYLPIPDNVDYLEKSGSLAEPTGSSAAINPIHADDCYAPEALCSPHQGSSCTRRGTAHKRPE